MTLESQMPDSTRRRVGHNGRPGITRGLLMALSVSLFLGLLAQSFPASAVASAPCGSTGTTTLAANSQVRLYRGAGQSGQGGTAPVFNCLKSSGKSRRLGPLQRFGKSASVRGPFAIKGTWAAVVEERKSGPDSAKVYVISQDARTGKARRCLAGSGDRPWPLPSDSTPIRHQCWRPCMGRDHGEPNGSGTGNRRLRFPRQSDSRLRRRRRNRLSGTARIEAVLGGRRRSPLRATAIACCPRLAHGRPVEGSPLRPPASPPAPPALDLTLSARSAAGSSLCRCVLEPQRQRRSVFPPRSARLWPTPA